MAVSGFSLPPLPPHSGDLIIEPPGTPTSSEKGEDLKQSSAVEQEWFVELLEEHQRRIRNDIAAHFALLWPSTHPGFQTGGLVGRAFREPGSQNGHLHPIYNGARPPPIVEEAPVPLEDDFKQERCSTNADKNLAEESMMLAAFAEQSLALSSVTVASVAGGLEGTSVPLSVRSCTFSASPDCTSTTAPPAAYERSSQRSKASDCSRIDVHRIRATVQGISNRDMNERLTATSTGHSFSEILGAPNHDQDTPILDRAISLVIIVNVIVMMIELQYQGYRSEVSFGIHLNGDAWQHAEFIFHVIEHIFAATFLIELILRFRILRCSYFKILLNQIDFLLVVGTCVQLYILEPLDAASGSNLTLFRLLRFIRFLRILKVMRLQVFSELRVLIQTCLSSMRALLWSMALLYLIMIVGGLFLCSLLRGVIQDPTENHDLRRWLYQFYGNPLRASYTLFEVTFAGCWPNYFRPLIERVNPWYVIFVLVYITLVVFAVIRIITALFLKQTLQAASNDAEMMLGEQRAKTAATVEKLAAVFRALDTEENGMIRSREFALVMNDPDVKTWLQTLDLEVHDVDGLFHLLDDGDGAITYEEFLPGILRLKGQARSLDVVAIGRHCDSIAGTLKTLEAKINFLLPPGKADELMARRSSEGKKIQRWDSSDHAW